MINQQLLDFINKAKNTGQTDEQIKAQLIPGGWKAGEIEEGIKQVNINISNTPISSINNNEVPMPLSKSLSTAIIIFYFLSIVSLIYLIFGVFFSYSRPIDVLFNLQTIPGLIGSNVGNTLDIVFAILSCLFGITSMQLAKIAKNKDKARDNFYVRHSKSLGNAVVVLGVIFLLQFILINIFRP